MWSVNVGVDWVREEFFKGRMTILWLQSVHMMLISRPIVLVMMQDLELVLQGIEYGRSFCRFWKIQLVK